MSMSSATDVASEYLLVSLFFNYAATFNDKSRKYDFQANIASNAALNKVSVK